MNAAGLPVSRRALLRAAVAVPGLCAAAAQTGEKSIRIGWADWADWADAEAITCVTQLV